MHNEEISRIKSIVGRNAGGEALVLTTKFFDNGYINQELTLQSYGNSATFNLCGTVFDPETLRRIADEIECGQVVAKRGIKERHAEAEAHAKSARAQSRSRGGF